MNDRQHIESYMRTRQRTMTKYDWYQAGTYAGSAPSEWEMVRYGRDTALGWYRYGGDSLDEAIGRGFDAMYRYAYDDIRDTIANRAGIRGTVSATSETEIHALNVPAQITGDIELFDWIARAPLSVQQQRIVTLYSLGWNLAEAAADLQLPYTSVRRWFRLALPVLKGEI